MTTIYAQATCNLKMICNIQHMHTVYFEELQCDYSNRAS